MDRAEMEAAVELHEELRKRRSTDPLFTFEPHTKQRRFIEAVLNYRHPECWFIAANRAGKSLAGSYCGATLARFGDPTTRYQNLGGISARDTATTGWVVSLDANTSRDVIQPLYFDNGYGVPGTQPFIPKREIAAWRPHEQILKLKNGSLIGFKNNEQSRVKFQGTAKDWIHFDEEPEYNVYNECVIRVGSTKLRVFGTCTLLPPEGQLGGVSWVFSEIIKPFQRGEKSNVGLFGCSIYDNPHLPEEEIKRLESIYPEGSTQRQIRLGGEWLPGMGGARAYPAFVPEKHLREQSDPNPRRPLLWTMDFNVEPMCSLVCQRGIDEEGLPIYRVIREIVLDEGNIFELCDVFRNYFPRHGSDLIVYGDATGKGRTAQTGESDYALVMRAMRGYGVPVKMKVPEQNPPVPDRINAVNHALQDEHGRSRVEIDPSCQELIADLEGVLRDKHGGIKKTTNRRDPYFRRSHASDALGYLLAYEEPVHMLSVRSSGSEIKVPTPGYGFAKK